MYTIFFFFFFFFKKFWTVSNCWLRVLRTDAVSLSSNSLRTIILFKFVIHVNQRCLRIRGWFRNSLLEFKKKKKKGKEFSYSERESQNIWYLNIWKKCSFLKNTGNIQIFKIFCHSVYSCISFSLLGSVLYSDSIISTASNDGIKIDQSHWCSLLLFLFYHIYVW